MFTPTAANPTVRPALQKRRVHTSGPQSQPHCTHFSCPQFSERIEFTQLPLQLTLNFEAMHITAPRQMKGPTIYNSVDKDLSLEEVSPGITNLLPTGRALILGHVPLAALFRSFLHLSLLLPPPPPSLSMCLSVLPSPSSFPPPPCCCCRLGAGGYENELRAQETVIIC